jgi:hypothetical protein
MHARLPKKNEEMASECRLERRTLLPPDMFMLILLFCVMDSMHAKSKKGKAASGGGNPKMQHV